MSYLQKILSALFLLFLCDFHFTPLSVLIFFYINIFPELTFRKTSTVRNKILEDGVCLLELFLVTVIAAPACFLISMWFDKTSLPDDSSAWLALLPKLLLWSVSEAILFWNGILRVYLTSVQLGIKWRIIGILCGWIPERVQQRVARTYNAALSKCGDHDPDFLEAVRDLTASACARLNQQLPDDPSIYYQSVGSTMNHAVSGRFALNMSYPLVRHFDGANDGLVALDSMQWGSSFIRLQIPEGRGISHGDMIDLNRENIPGFDVREFYTGLVKDLKERGY